MGENFCSVGICFSRTKNREIFFYSPERVDCDLSHSQVVAPLQHFRHLVEALRVALDLVDLVDAGEAAVPVHDERDVPGDLAAKKPRL